MRPPCAPHSTATPRFSRRCVLARWWSIRRCGLRSAPCWRPPSPRCRATMRASRSSDRSRAPRSTTSRPSQRCPSTSARMAGRPAMHIRGCRHVDLPRHGGSRAAVSRGAAMVLRHSTRGPRPQRGQDSTVILRSAPRPMARRSGPQPGAFLRGFLDRRAARPFSAAGQVWGLPVPHPHAEDHEGFARLLRANMRHARALRLDHAMGLERLFVVPRVLPQAKAATSAMMAPDCWRHLRAKSRTAGCAVVGEALGTVPEGFADRLLPHASWPTACLVRDRWRRLPRPGQLAELAAACVSTHDLRRSPVGGTAPTSRSARRLDYWLLPRFRARLLPARRARDIGGSLRYREQTLLACHRRGRAPFRRHRAEPMLLVRPRTSPANESASICGHRSRAPELAATAAVFSTTLGRIRSLRCHP